MKKKINLSITILLILALAITLPSCGGDDSGSKGDDSAVLATVGDSEITQKEVEGISAYYAFSSYGMKFSEFDEEQAKQMNAMLLQYAVELDLLKEHFKGKDVLPEDFEGEFQSYLEETVYASGENAEEELKAAGVTEEDMKFFYEGNYYSEAFMNEINEKDPVSEDQIESYYNEHKEEYTTGGTVKASHILIQDEEHTDANRKKIEGIREKIVDGGQSFEKMAKKYSDDGSAESGGDLGYFGKGQMVAEFEDAAYSLDKGEVSEVVETEYGFHIIKVTGKKKERQLTLKEAHDQVKSAVEYQNYVDGVESLKNEIGVEYTKDGEELKALTDAQANGGEEASTTSDEAVDGDDSASDEAVDDK